MTMLVLCVVVPCRWTPHDPVLLVQVENLQRVVVKLHQALQEHDRTNDAWVDHTTRKLEKRYQDALQAEAEAEVRVGCRGCVMVSPLFTLRIPTGAGERGCKTTQHFWGTNGKSTERESGPAAPHRPAVQL